MEAGVSKLNEARLLVDNLKSKAAEQSKLLAEKQAEADDALKQITSSMSAGVSKLNEARLLVDNLKSKAAEQSKLLAEKQAEADDALKQITSSMSKAKAAVGNIRSEALSEIRSLRAPPDIIRDILEGVLRLMGIFDTSWVSMKSFLSKRGVKEEIISFDARKITPEIRYSVDQLLSKNHESFDPKNAKRASAAAAPLASWVKANVKYSQVLEKVSPLEKEQAKLQHNLVSAERRINKLSGALEDVEQEVIHLRDKLSKFTKEAAEIEFNLKHSKEIIISAETLVQQLDSEYQRWTKQLGEIDKELTKLPVQSLLAAAFITYLSSSSEDIRQINIEKWCSILGYKSFDLKQFLSNEQEQLTWKTEGLPSDLLSIENAIIILQLSKLEIGLSKLEIGVSPRYVIQIGEKLVDFNENFKMFLITKYSSLELPPYASALITTVNFSTTKAGLMGQLLAAVLQHEKPELEQRRMQLLEQEEELKLQLTKLEESLLEQLASAQGNILENKELIASLNNTKSSSLNISSALKESQQLQLSLEEERKVYLPLAQFGSNLYFVITELIKLNNMYDFSLSTFFKLFNQALATDKISNSPEDRMKGLIQSLQHLVYEYVCRSLFKTDRLTFAMHLIHGMYTQHFQEN
ncbi:cytoplasmic dynein 2 heavy chain 1-like, partial [Centruroides sculpturatus]|uniref:cytoplasmic dynein 2 heavy chain 1-like n=1 Tax=Centruroides sculpturatus TaxID=218467 RepID=UPI000C6D4375